MKKALSVCSIVLRIVLCVLVGVLLVYNVYMLIAKLAFKQQMPTFLGFASAAVVSGSMEPTINTGDFIITLKRNGYEVGEVVMFFEGGVYTTHRIVEETEDGFRTMGDNNEGSLDPWTVREENIVGEVVLVLRGFGGARAARVREGGGVLPDPRGHDVHRRRGGALVGARRTALFHQKEKGERK